MMLGLGKIYQVIYIFRRLGESSENYRGKCWISYKGTVKWLMAAKYASHCFADNTWWPYNTMNCTIQFGSWSHSGDEIKLVSVQNTVLFLSFFIKIDLFCV